MLFATTNEPTTLAAGILSSVTSPKFNSPFEPKNESKLFFFEPNPLDNDSPTVFLIDDDTSVRKSLQMILNVGSFHVKPFESATTFLEQYDPRNRGCILTDVRMPGMDGLQLLARLAEIHCTLPIIVLTGHADVRMAVSAMQSGAFDFLEKPTDPNLLRSKVDVALKHDASNAETKQEQAEIELLINSLTTREHEVMQLLISSKTPKIIGKILGTAQSTIRIQRQSILKKMQADNVSDLIRMLGRAGRLED